MSNRKLAFVVLALCVGVIASAAWYLAGDVMAAQERTQARPSPIPTSMALPVGSSLGRSLADAGRSLDSQGS